eukprot:1460432-Rhodomonas_salina.1
MPMFSFPKEVKKSHVRMMGCQVAALCGASILMKDQVEPRDHFCCRALCPVLTQCLVVRGGGQVHPRVPHVRLHLAAVLRRQGLPPRKLRRRARARCLRPEGDRAGQPQAVRDAVRGNVQHHGNRCSLLRQH